MIRLFASDLDGTLLNGEHEVDDVIRDVLRQITAAGKYFTAATGRQMRADQMAETGFDEIDMYNVNMNGALIVDNKGQVLRKRSISREFLRALLEAFPTLGFEFHGPEHTYVRISREAFIEEFRNRPAPPSMPPMTEEKRNVMLDRFLRKMRFDQSNETIAEQEILKINYRTTDPRERACLNAFLKKHEAEATNAPFDDDGYEITGHNVNKGEAVAWLAAHLGISEDETAVYGDGYNDLKMLEHFTHSYATMDAVPEAKAAAREIIGYCADHAVPEHILMTLKEEE